MPRTHHDPDTRSAALSAARDAYREIYPDATPGDADRCVTSLADAMFVLLQREGLLGSGRTMRPEPRRDRR